MRRITLAPQGPERLAIAGRSGSALLAHAIDSNGDGIAGLKWPQSGQTPLETSRSHPAGRQKQEAGFYHFTRQGTMRCGAHLGTFGLSGQMLCAEDRVPATLIAFRSASAKEIQATSTDLYPTESSTCAYAFGCRSCRLRSGECETSTLRYRNRSSGPQPRARSPSLTQSNLVPVSAIIKFSRDTSCATNQWPELEMGNVAGRQATIPLERQLAANREQRHITPSQTPNIG